MSSSSSTTPSQRPRPPLLVEISKEPQRYTPTFPCPHTSPSSFLPTRKTYGTQLLVSAAPISSLLVGRLAVKHPLRREQINKVVTSGVSPNGGVSGYGSLGKQLEVKAREMERELEGCEGSTALEQLERIMVWDLKPIRSALQTSAHLAVTIRATQTLMDGNHRTALLTFVLSLASSHVLLRPTFCIYRAYLIISARDHPENQENMLFSTGISEVSEELFRYARKRVRPGTPTWGYVEEMAERVRAVVVRASVVEEVYDFMKVGSRWENGEERWFGREQQGEVWSGCTAELKRDIGLAHMAFVPAGREGAGIRRRVT